MLQTVKSLAGTPVSSSHTPVERPLPAEGMSLYWNETRPYGAPKVTVRGGATRIPEVKDILKENGFMWDPPAHAWIGYHYGSELQEILSQVEENTGASVQEKVYDHPSEDTDAMLTDMRENRTESAPAGEQRDTGGLPF
jgi:hypothetical protein